MAAVEERKILYRKSAPLIDLELTREQMESFFDSGLLPGKLKNSIRTLKTAPNMRATEDFILALRTHGREGAVHALAELLEPTHPRLMDELLAELALLRHELPLDEHTLDEMSTLVHRKYGASRKLGPVDQRLLREMLVERAVVRRNASQRHLQREVGVMQAERGRSQLRDAAVREQVLRLEEFIRKHNIRQTLSKMRVASEPKVVAKRGPEAEVGDAVVEANGLEQQQAVVEDLSPEKTYQDLNNLLDDVFSNIRNTITDIETRKAEKQRLFAVIAQTEQHDFVDVEPVHSLLLRIFQKHDDNMRIQRTKMHIAEERVCEMQTALSKAKRDRPLKVASKVNTDDRVREKFEMTEETNRELEEKERVLKAELQALRAVIGDHRQKFNFLNASRTVKLIRMRSRDKTRYQNLAKQVVQQAEADVDGDVLPPRTDGEFYSRLSRQNKGRTKSEVTSRVDHRWSQDNSDSSDDEKRHAGSFNGYGSLSGICGNRTGNATGRNTLRNTPRNMPRNGPQHTTPR